MLNLISLIYFNNLEVYEICNTSYWKALNGGEIVSVGRHLDVFVKRSDGIWLCKRRVIQHVWTKEDGHIEYAKQFS